MGQPKLILSNLTVITLLLSFLLKYQVASEI